MPEPTGAPQERGLTRRDLLIRGAAGGGLLLLGGNLLSACGGSSAGSDSFRVGLSGGSGTGATLDAGAPFGFPVDIGRYANLYDSLTDRTPDGAMSYALAEEIEPSADARTWTLRLKDGLEFHNGKTVTADDVVFSIQRILGPGSESASIDLYSPYIDPKGITKVDARTVKFVLKRPAAIFPELFSQYPTAYIVPTGYDPANPVGTGPFKYKSFTPGQQSVFEAFENFWGNGPNVQELVVIDFPDATARVNALVGGQVDAVDAVPIAQIPVVEGDSKLAILESQSKFALPLTMRTDQAPFDDPRVREAFRLIADRPQMLRQVLAGKGTIGNDYYAPGGSCGSDTIAQRAAAIEEAKALLAQAGKSGLTVELATTDLAVGTVEMCQVFAEQAKAAGVTVKVSQLDYNAYINNYGNHLFGVDAVYNAPYLVLAGQNLIPDAPYNSTHFDDPEYNALFDSALKELDEGRRCEIVAQMKEIDQERGGLLVWGFADTIDAHRTGVEGLAPDTQGLGFSHLRFNEVKLA